MTISLVSRFLVIAKESSSEYGNIELAKKAVAARTDRADEALEALRENEQELAKSLEEKYGRGSINLEDGTFLPFEEEGDQAEEESTEEESAE